MTDQLWHDLRAKNIGGSDVAALFGESPYMSAYKLWQIKAGNIQPDDFSDNERAEAGNMLEPSIIAWANKKWGYDFYQPHVYVMSETVKGMACTPDAYSQSDKTILAQVKNVDSIQFGRKEKGWVCDGDVITQAPLDIWLQCQHELGCHPEMRENHLIVCVGGNRLLRMVIERNETVIQEIEKKVTEFWGSIIANDPPAPDYKEDGETIVKIKGAMPTLNAVDMSGDNMLADAVFRFEEVKAQIKLLEGVEKELKAMILDKVLPHEAVVVGDTIVKITRSAGTPDKQITPDMVGTYIKGRSGWVSFTTKKAA